MLQQARGFDIELSNISILQASHDPVQASLWRNRLDSLDLTKSGSQHKHSRNIDQGRSAHPKIIIVSSVKPSRMPCKKCIMGREYGLGCDTILHRPSESLSG